MKTAVYVGDIKRIIKAQEEFQIRNTDFVLYDNGSIDGAHNSSNATFKDCQILAPIFIKTGNGTGLLTIYAGTHVNSTSYADDLTNGHPNTGSDDIRTPISNSLMGTLTHPTGGDYMIEAVYFAYCPAVHPPNIDVPRLRTALKSSGNDYNSIFVNANINVFSPTKPNKTTPHSVDEVLGYSPNYAPVVITNPVGTWSILEGDTAKTFTFKWLTDGSSSINSLDLHGVIVNSPAKVGSATKDYTAGTYTVISKFKYNNVDYVSSTTTLIVNPAPIIITGFNITNYDSFSQQATLDITASASNGYKCFIQTTWVENMTIIGSVRTDMGQTTVSAGNQTVLWNIPQTRPSSTTGNETLGGIIIDYCRNDGTVIKRANFTIL